MPDTLTIPETVTVPTETLMEVAAELYSVSDLLACLNEGDTSVGERLTELAHKYPNAEGLTARALKQAARELLLAQSSDWAFIMKTGTMVEYACERTKVHVLNFNHLYEQLKKNELDDAWLSQVERRHNLFPNMDYRVYA